MPFTDVLNRRVFYAHRAPVPAEGPAVVFIHGAGGNHQPWLYQVRNLSRRETYAPDLPGHGRSEGPGRDRIAAYGDWLVAFLDAVELEQAVLVGHSMGGAIAQEVALRYPQRVAGLGLVGTGARLRVAPAILEGIRRDFEAAVRLITGFAFGPEAAEEMKRLSRRQMAQTPPDVLYGDFIACDKFDALGRLEGIGAPAAVVCGTQDRLTPVKFSSYLRDHLPDAHLHLVEGAGHMVMVERPQAVAQALEALLGRV